jgi:hypothetical protein
MCTIAGSAPMPQVTVYPAEPSLGGSHRRISPPAFPSNWNVPPSRRSPLTGRNQRGMRSAEVTASHKSSIGAG